MFVQVIQGKASDPEGLQAQFERWAEELAPGAEGYLGSTAGVAADGTFVALARFEDEKTAQANSDRSEQGQWWEETSKHLEGEATFRNCTDVDLFLEGGSDGAGFVQVILAEINDPDRYREMENEFNDRIRELRPEILGGYVAWDGNFVTEVVYFASEHTAREGEGKALPEDLRNSMDEWRSLMGEEVTYIDLTDPWLHSPGSDEDSE
jgi:hypothetical protein